MVADVSAVANPNTGVAVYDSTPYAGASGWMVFGGTSLASPLIAATYVLSGNSSTLSNAYPYTHTGSLNDVTSGSNGHCRRVPTLFCNAVSGYDGPTGLGTPNGTGAF
jgi:subtilase family serine protease